MEFSSLGFLNKDVKKSVTKIVPVENTPQEGTRLNFEKDILNKKPKLTKEQLRVIEPGHKIPVASFLQMGKYCDDCNDVQAHAHDPINKKITCLKCKTTKTYK